MLSQIESMHHEARIFRPEITFGNSTCIATQEQYDQLVNAAKADYPGFWANLARQHLSWHQPFTQILDESQAPFYRWFADGMLNVSYHCLDLQIQKGNAKKIAIIFEDDQGEVLKIDYQSLLARVCQLANALKQQNVYKGDRVLIYLPMSIEAVVAMLACARIGAVHSVVFGGFSAHALHERIVDTGACLLITSDEQRRSGKVLPIKAIVDEALAMGDTHSIQAVWVVRKTGGTVALQPSRDQWLDNIVAQQASECSPEWIEAEHPLFILYTSGSTGKPKGVVHSSAGYLLWAKLTMLWTFDLKPQDIYWCTADIGWITGHTYIAYGPLAAGATQLIFEGVPVYPHCGRFWEMIDRHQVSIFYTAPTAIRSLIKASSNDAQHHPRAYQLSSLRILGVVGEPINPEAWIWYYTEIGKQRCPIMDTWWQTETGGHMISPLPAFTPLVPGSCTVPLPGIIACVVDETGAEVANGQGGMLVIKKPWPSMIRTIWNNPERFKKGYFPQELGGTVYLAGDSAVRDPQTAYFTIMGRIDDVLNVSGHRLGTMEIESALVAHPMVAEAAVIGCADETSGEAIIAFVVLKGTQPLQHKISEIAHELRQWVSQQIGPIAKPKEIRFGENLPKTRSGKIMRRLLRALANNETIEQDTSTLENPAILEQLKQTR